jgi:hypothetical protein
MSTLKELKAMGAFTSDKPVRKEIKFTLNGEDLSAVIHVKHLGIGEYESLFLGDDESRSRTAKAISHAVTLGEDGKERISFQDAYRLEPVLAGAMLTAFNEVNTPKKSSRPASVSSAT